MKPITALLISPLTIMIVSCGSPKPLHVLPVAPDCPKPTFPKAITDPVIVPDFLTQ